MSKDNGDSISRARRFIKNILTQTIDNPNNPDSLNFFQADTYRFYFLMSFMWEYLEGNEISYIIQCHVFSSEEALTHQSLNSLHGHILPTD